MYYKAEHDASTLRKGVVAVSIQSDRKAVARVDASTALVERSRRKKGSVKARVALSSPRGELARRWIR